jgi:hypothetical protein
VGLDVATADADIAQGMIVELAKLPNRLLVSALSAQSLQGLGHKALGFREEAAAFPGMPVKGGVSGGLSLLRAHGASPNLWRQTALAA